MRCIRYTITIWTRRCRSSQCLEPYAQTYIHNSSNRCNYQSIDAAAGLLHFEGTGGARGPMVVP